MKIGLTLLLAVGLILGCGSSQQASTPSVDGSSNEAMLEASFHIFRTPAEALSVTMRKHLRNLIAKNQHEFRPALVQRGRTTNGIVWVFVNGDAVCLAENNQGAVACSPGPDAIADGVTLGVFTPPNQRVAKPHDFLLFGLAPDGSQHAVLAVGQQRRIRAINNNLFSARANEPILIRRLLRSRQ